MPKKRSAQKSSSKAAKKVKKDVKESATDKEEVKLQTADVKADGDKIEEKEVKLVSIGGEASNLKITSWNVNGIRANIKNGGFKWVLEDAADIVCLQETKCSDQDLPTELNKIDGYYGYWHAADKKGYSGVAVLSKEKPVSVKYGIGIDEHDHEGRTVTVEYEKLFVVNTYVPNSQRKLARLDYRQKWDSDLQAYLTGLAAEKAVVLCGDLNVSHKEIDLSNPKSNRRNAGFTDEERAGMDAMLGNDETVNFIDSFRHLYPDMTGQYTFWTYMGNARARNVGWRLDYFILSKQLEQKLCDSVIHSKVMGSDHCPISLYLAL